MADLELNPREAYGQLYFLDNTIESLTGDIDIEIGMTGSVADLKFNRNTVLASGKTFGLVDSVTEEIVRMSVSGGVLDIDGANQLQVGQLKFVDNTIESETPTIDIEIGLTGSAADLKLNRNVVLAKGKSLSLVDHYLDETTTLTVISGSLHVSGANQLEIGNIQIYNNTIESDEPTIDIQLGATTATADLIINRNTILYSGKTLTVQGNSYYSGSVNITGSLYLTGSGGVGFINSHRILTELDSGSFAITGSNVFTSGQTITGSVNITGSIIMDGTAQTNILHTVTNPSNYVLHQFLTSSYHGGTYAFSAHNNVNGKVTVYSNYIVAQGGGGIDLKIGGDSKLESTAGAPNPTFAVGFSGSYAQFKVTDTGTFTYRGIIHLY